MIKGISKENVPHFSLKEYKNLDESKIILIEFLHNLK
jgi:hypothetical protein